MHKTALEFFIFGDGFFAGTMACLCVTYFRRAMQSRRQSGRR